MTEPAQLSLSYEELVGFALGALEGVSQNFDEATRLRLIHLGDFVEPLRTLSRANPDAAPGPDMTLWQPRGPPPA